MSLLFEKQNIPIIGLVGVFLLLLIVPLGFIYHPFEFNPEWRATFVWKDGLLAVPYFALLLFWWLFRKAKSTVMRIVFMMVILMVSIGMAIIGWMPMVLPTPDYIYSYGAFLVMVLPAAFIIYFIHEYRQRQRQRPRMENEHLLDDLM